MNKSKLQELCHKRLWNLPDYQTKKEGPDHNPRYVSTVTVNGIDFQTPRPSRNAKESQNNAAKLAFDHFSRPKTPSLPNPPSSSSSPQTSNSPSVSHPSLPQPSPTPPTPSPQLSFSQPSFPQTSDSTSVSHPSLPQPSSTPPTPSPQLSFSQPSFPQTSFSLPQPSALVSSGSSISGTDVDEVLPTISVMQPMLQDALQAIQINKPITSFKDNMTAGNQRNDPTLSSVIDMQRLYKNQLQNYAQKKSLNLPIYSTQREGPPHASLFKCKVTIDGQTYESPDFFSTLKDAEHAAAKVALMSLSLFGAQEDDNGLYKNLLQELVQREGFHLPVYSTGKSGESHMPIFVSNVEIEGERFTGQEAKTKKQAEMSAAKVAYTILKERKGKSNQSSSVLLSAHQEKGPVLSSPSSDSNVSTDLQHHANLKSPTSYSPGLVTKNQSGKDKDCAEVKSNHAAIPSSEPIAVTGGTDSSSSDITAVSVDVSSLPNVQSSPSLPNSDNPVMNSSGIASTAMSTSTCRKVTVYSRTTNVEIAQGGTSLPISDENWVAYSYPE